MKTKVELTEGRPVATPSNPNPPTLPQTLGEIANYTKIHEWQDKKSSRELSRNSEMVCAVLGENTKIADITKFEIDGIIQNWKAGGSSNGTINRKLAALSKMFTTAIELEVISKRPIIKRLPEAQHRVRFYTDEDFRKMGELCELFQSPTSNRWKQFYEYLVFMADTGLRQSEAFNMKWKDVLDHPPYSPERKAILIKDTKNQEDRVIPLTTKAQKILEDIQIEGSEDGPWVWWTKPRLRQYWATLRNAMGWEHDKQAVLHTLRHTFCSRLVQKGVPLPIVRDLAGHKRIEMTLRYSHLSPHDLLTSIDVLNQGEAIN